MGPRPARASPHGGWLGVSRARAVFVHLGLSLLLLAAAAVPVLAWYPAPYFDAVNAWGIAQIPLLVFFGVGPLLTLLLFKPGKRGLLIDVVLIAVLQTAAYAHGLYVLHGERPAFAVFAVDRFVLLGTNHVDAAQLATARAAHVFDAAERGPALVVAKLPTDESERQKLLDETLFQGKPDIESRPELWHRFADETQQVLARQEPLAALRAARPAAAAEIASAAATLNAAETDLGFVPLAVGARYLAAILDPQTGAPRAIVDTDPWID